MAKTLDALTPQQLETQGEAAYRNGDFPTAADIFRAAEEGFKTEGDALKAAEMANNRSVAWLQAGEFESAYQAVEGTVQQFQELGDKLRQAKALGNRAAALEALGKTDLAAADYQKSAHLLEEIDEQEMRLQVLRALSGLHLKNRKPLQALAAMQAGIAGVKNPNAVQRLLKRLLGLPARLVGS
jgi:tetratricopeptide (TPR) repeat protein